MQEQMGRSPCCSETGLKKGPWTPEEDKKLLEYVQTHGHGSWQQLPKLAGLNRCGKSCRLRWTNYLRPDIKRGSFSEEEARLIIQLHSLLGNKWSSIANHLPGRTDNEIKNYWNTHLRKKLIRMGIDPATHMPRTDLNLLPSITSLLAAANYSANNSPSHLDNVLNLQAADTAILQVRLQLVQHLFQMLTSNTTSNLELLSLYGSASLINSQLENCLNLQRSISMPAASIPSFSLKPLANNSLPIPESRLSMYGAHATPSDGSLAKDVDKEIEHSGNANSCIFPSSKCIACRETTHVDPSKLLCDVSIDLPASTIPSEAWEGVDDLDVFGWK